MPLLFAPHADRVPGMHLTIGTWRMSTPLWPTLAAVPVLALLVGLGLWQLDRAAGKVSLHERFDSRSAAAPLEIDERAAEPLLADAEQHVYRRAVVRGRYLAGRQYLLDNQVNAGQAGYHVLTPLALGSDWIVLVNRGWVPVGPSRASLPAVPVPAREVTARGVLATGDTGALLLGDSGYDEERWPRVVQRVEYDTIARQLGASVLPLVMRLDGDAAEGFVRVWPPYRGIGPDRHRAYAFQWFSLATALVIIYVVVNTRRATR